MSTGLVAVGGWLLAAVAAGCGLLARHTLAKRIEIAARACHELRGPLTAARLGPASAPTRAPMCTAIPPISNLTIRFFRSAIDSTPSGAQS